tara:strand:+ start:1065 stop:1322 length:258 start_codon:yes stop_codon:yes gene_type:complete
MTTRKFIASSELFCDYSLDISLLNIDTLDDIIEIFKNSLVKIFEENNLTNLKKKVNETKFHIHTYSIEDILTSDSKQVFFICDHC